MSAVTTTWLFPFPLLKYLTGQEWILLWSEQSIIIFLEYSEKVDNRLLLFLIHLIAFESPLKVMPGDAPWNPDDED